MGGDTQPPSPDTISSNFLKILLEDFLHVYLLLLLMDWFFILGDIAYNFRYLVSLESSEDLASSTSYKAQLLEPRRSTCLFRRRLCCPGHGNFTRPCSCLPNHPGPRSSPLSSPVPCPIPSMPPCSAYKSAPWEPGSGVCSPHLILTFSEGIGSPHHFAS